MNNEETVKDLVWNCVAWLDPNFNQDIEFGDIFKSENDMWIVDITPIEIKEKKTKCTLRISKKILTDYIRGMENVFDCPDTKDIVETILF